MEYTTEYDKNSSVLTITVKGEYKRPQDAKALQQYMMKFGVENNCRRFLVNFKNAHLVGKTVHIFEASVMPGDPNHKLANSRIALVYEQITEDQKFVENIAYNIGFRVLVFDDLEKAMAWLTN